MSRVIFINRFYWPDETATAQLLRDLAEGLAARGRSVTVITSCPAAAPQSEIRRGVDIERVRSTRGDGGASLTRKAFDLGSFYAAALWQLARRARRGDSVVALTDPPLIGTGAWLIARLRRAECYQWVQDIYPEIATALTGSIGLRWLRIPRNWAWRGSQACVTLGEDMAKVLTAAGVSPAKIHVVANWSPACPRAAEASAISALRQSWNLEGKFVLIYSGNLGRVHDLAPVLDVAAALRDQEKIVFLFVGAGPQRRELEAEAGRRQLPQVQFRPPQPRENLAAVLALGDVHLVTLRAGCERYVFPSKLYGAAASGRPVIFLGASNAEVARVIAREGFGYAFDRGQVPDFARTLIELSQNPGLRDKLSRRALQFAALAPATSAIERWDGILKDPNFPPQPR